MRKKIINFPLLEGKIWSFVLGMSFSSLRPEKQGWGLILSDKQQEETPLVAKKDIEVNEKCTLLLACFITPENVS